MLHARVFALIVLASAAACPERLARTESPAPLAAETQAAAELEGPPAPDLFTTSVLPVLERRCTPCHFTGGVMHAKLPFDEPETIRELGDHLFTRIKDPAEQDVIRAFLAAGGPRAAE